MRFYFTDIEELTSVRYLLFQFNVQKYKLNQLVKWTCRKFGQCEENASPVNLPQACNLIKKRLWHRCFCEISKNIFFTEHLRSTAPVYSFLVYFNFDGTLFIFGWKGTQTPLASFWHLYCELWTYFTPFSSVSIVNFEQVNAG